MTRARPPATGVQSGDCRGPGLGAERRAGRLRISGQQQQQRLEPEGPWRDGLGWGAQVSAEKWACTHDPSAGFQPRLRLSPSLGNTGPGPGGQTILMKTQFLQLGSRGHTALRGPRRWAVDTHPEQEAGGDGPQAGARPSAEHAWEPMGSGGGGRRGYRLLPQPWGSWGGQGIPRLGDQGAFLTCQKAGAHRVWSAGRPPVSAGRARVDQRDRRQRQKLWFISVSCGALH